MKILGSQNNSTKQALSLIVFCAMCSAQAFGATLWAQSESSTSEDTFATPESTPPPEKAASESKPVEKTAQEPTESSAESPAPDASGAEKKQNSADDPDDKVGEKKEPRSSRRRLSRRAKSTQFTVLSPAPQGLIGRNLPFGLGLGWKQKVNNEADLLTGLRSNQTVTGLLFETQLFIPHSKTTPLLNVIGLGATFEFDSPYQIVGRDIAAGETQTLEWSALGFQVFPVAQISAQKGSLSRLWLQPFGYAYRSAKMKVSSGGELGSASLTLVRKGMFSLLGGEYSFFPYVHTGLELLLGWGQSWEAKNSTTAERSSGQWNYIEPRVLMTFRYPTRKSFISILNFSIAAGASVEFFKGEGPEQSFPGRKTAGLLSLKAGWQFQPPTVPVSADAR